MGKLPKIKNETESEQKLREAIAKVERLNLKASEINTALRLANRYLKKVKDQMTEATKNRN